MGTRSRAGRPSLKPPQPGLLLKRFEDGYRIKNLGVGAEDVLRDEVVLLRQTLAVVHGGLGDLSAALLQSLAADLDDRPTDGWKRWHRQGAGHGKMQILRALTQLYHRGLIMMLKGK